MRINIDEQENHEPSMAPLLDCIFLLLIFFLVATSFEHQKMDEEEVMQLEIQLPDSAAALTASGVSAEPLVLAVDNRGRIYVEGKRIKTDALHQLLKDQALANPNRRIRLDGDRGTPLQHIVHLLDLCEFEGLKNIGIRAASDAAY